MLQYTGRKPVRGSPPRLFQSTTELSRLSTAQRGCNRYYLLRDDRSNTGEPSHLGASHISMRSKRPAPPAPAPTPVAQHAAPLACAPIGCVELDEWTIRNSWTIVSREAKAQQLLLPATLRNVERDNLLGQRWEALLEAESKLQSKRAKVAPSAPTLGSPTAAATTLPTSGLYAEAEQFLWSEFLDTALKNMTEAEAIEVMLGEDPSADRAQPRLCLDGQQQRSPQSLQELFATHVMCDYTPRPPNSLPMLRWASITQLSSQLAQFASAEVARLGPSGLKQMITECQQNHPAFAGLPSGAWCKKLKDDRPGAHYRSKIAKFAFAYTPRSQATTRSLPPIELIHWTARSADQHASGHQRRGRQVGRGGSQLHTQPYPEAVHAVLAEAAKLRVNFDHR